jgi:hypothetical protein
VFGVEVVKEDVLALLPVTPKPKRKAGPGTERIYDYAAIETAAENALKRGRPDTKALFYEKVRAELKMMKKKAPPEDDDSTLRRVAGPLYDAAKG